MRIRRVPIASGGAPSGPAGGELAGTYPNPTVLAAHSGTTHAATEAAAEATAAAAAVVHAALADAHHAASHTLASHSAKTHSDLTGVGATDHHSNANDHANTLDHANTNDPTANQKAALAGTGTPSGTDKYVNDSDSRMTNARIPSAHASTHAPSGSDPLLVSSGSYTPSSMTVPTGTWMLTVDTLKLTSTQALIARGTAVVRGIGTSK